MPIDPNSIQWDPTPATGMVPLAPPVPKRYTPQPPAVEEGTRTTTTRTQQEIRQKPLSEADTKTIDLFREKASSATELIRDIRAGAKTVDRFGTNPQKAFAASKAMGRPDPAQSGYWDQFRGWIAGDVVSQQDKEDFQFLENLKNRAVLASQIEQKGPQTESDAARMTLTGIQPGNYKGVNGRILGEAMIKAQLAVRRPGFYTRWAQKYGSLQSLDQKGRSVDDAWNAMSTDAARRNASRPGGGKTKGDPFAGFSDEEIK